MMVVDNLFFSEPSGMDMFTGHSRQQRNAQRSVRRRDTREKALRAAYERLVDLEDASEYARSLFRSMKLDHNLIEKYLKVHRVVGPGATVTRDYVGLWISPKDVRERAEVGNINRFADTNLHSLEDVVKEPWYLRVLGCKRIDDICDVSVHSPGKAAQQAQNLLRGCGYDKAVVSAGEFCRSKKNCAAIVNEFAKALGCYKGQVECVMFNGFITLYGPNGRGDWEVNAPVDCLPEARDFFTLMTHLGYHRTLLFFESELSVLNVTISVSLLVPTEELIFSDINGPYVSCAGSVANEPGLSTPEPEKLLNNHEAVLADLEPNVKVGMAKRLSAVVEVSCSGKRACAVAVGAGAMLTVAHTIDSGLIDRAVVPAVDLPNDLIALLNPNSAEVAWNFRKPFVGELCSYLFVSDGRPLMSEPVTVFEAGDDGNIVTSRPYGLKEGNSGSALVSLTDCALLGLMQGYSRIASSELYSSAVDEHTFWLLTSIHHPELQAPGTYNSLVGRNLRMKFADVVNAMDRDDDGINYIRFPDGHYFRLCDRAGTVTPVNQGQLTMSIGGLSIDVDRVPLVSGNCGSLTVRKPLLNEKCVVLNLLSEDKAKTSRHVVVQRVSGDIISLSRPLVTGRSGVLLSMTDCAVVGFTVPSVNSTAFTFNCEMDFSSYLNFAKDLIRLDTGSLLVDLLKKSLGEAVQVFRSSIYESRETFIPDNALAVDHQRWLTNTVDHLSDEDAQSCAIGLGFYYIYPRQTEYDSETIVGRQKAFILSLGFYSDSVNESALFKSMMHSFIIK